MNHWSGLSRITVLLLLAFFASPAYASEWWNNPLAGETSMLSVTNIEFTPPDWLQPCPVLAATSEEILVKECMEEHSYQKTDRAAQRVKQTPLILQHMEHINDRVNKIVGGLEKSDMLSVALEKRRLLIDDGWPRSALLLAYCETELDDNATEHVVLVARLEKGDIVLDGDMSEILPWQFSPHRFYGIESPLESGKWFAIEDVRDDPAALAIEWACAEASC